MRLALDPGPLPVDRTHGPAIRAHWARTAVANPALYDGPVVMLSGWGVAGGTLTGTCHRTSFATTLWLREHWRPELATWTAFGTAILIAADGAALLGRMAAHTANPGRVYFPGGILDEGDVTGTAVDAAACVLRELAEETGLVPAESEADPGWLIAHRGRALSLGRIFRLPWPGAEAQAILRARIARQQAAELDDIVVLRRLAEADAHDMPDFARLTLGQVLES